MALLILAQRFEFATNNIWSVRYLHHRANLPSVEMPLSPPPASHQRATLWLAQTALQSGDLTEAETLLAPLAAEGNLLALSALGDVLAAQGDLQGALQKWDEAGNFASVAEIARQSAALGQLDVAQLAYEINLRFEPQTGVRPLAEFLWNKKDDLPAAEVVFRQALTDYPDSRYRTEWQLRLSSLLSSQERWDEAAAVYRQILTEKPEHTAVWIELGWVAYNRGDDLTVPQAIFEQAIAVDPQQSGGYFAMAQMLAKASHYAEADTWFQQAIERNPDKLEWYLVRANAQRTGGNLPLAIDLYQQTIGRFPDSAQAYYEQAWAYRLDEQSQEAIDAIEQAIQRLDKPDQRYYIRAGTIYEWANDIELAIDYYNLALTQNPNNRAALTGLQRLEDSQ